MIKDEFLDKINKIGFTYDKVSDDYFYKGYYVIINGESVHFRNILDRREHFFVGDYESIYKKIYEIFGRIIKINKLLEL